MGSAALDAAVNALGGDAEQALKTERHVASIRSIRRLLDLVNAEWAERPTDTFSVADTTLAELLLALEASFRVFVPAPASERVSLVGVPFLALRAPT